MEKILTLAACIAATSAIHIDAKTKSAELKQADKDLKSMDKLAAKIHSDEHPAKKEAGHKAEPKKTAPKKEAAHKELKKVAAKKAAPKAVKAATKAISHKAKVAAAVHEKKMVANCKATFTLAEKDCKSQMEKDLKKTVPKASEAKY